MSTATIHMDNKTSLRGGTTKKSHPLAPALRFKEFDGDYSKRILKDFTKINQGLQIPISERYSEQVEGSYFYITNEFLRKGSKKSYFIKNPTESVICTEEEILMTRTGNTGQVVTGVHGAFHNNFFKIKFDETCEKWYLYFFLTSYITQHKILTLAGTSTIPDLNHGDFYKLKITMPKYPEQQKIASFLSAVDEKIQQLIKKKTLLEDYKKGVMQQLFSGQLRFKDENGEAYPDWDEKIFSDLYSFHSTNSLSRDKLNYDAGSVYNIHYGDIHTKFKTAFKLNEAYIPFVNEDVDLSKIKDDLYCKSGDLVMADASEDYADIGKTIELIDLKDKNVLAGLHTFLARPITSKTTVGFFSVLLKSWSMRKQIMVIAQGTKVLSLSTTRVGKLKLKLPVIEEQQKIASYVSSIDTKIAAVTHQITQTQTFKKGLLQQLFV
jgi:type I restriction enzyme S subunit